MTLTEIKSMKRVKCAYKVCKWNSKNYCTNPNIKINIDATCESIQFKGS